MIGVLSFNDASVLSFNLVDEGARVAEKTVNGFCWDLCPLTFFIENSILII
jgi:hypothetical protein